MSETRALSAALSGPVFHGAASRSALHTSDRHVDRWAPEGDRATRAGGMRSLAFADRLVSPWIAGSNSAASRMFSSYASTGMRDRGAPEVSWLFPRPWFQDELDWMAAARQGLEETPRASSLTTRGTFMRSERAPDRPSSFAQVAMPVLAPPVMAAVAPSMAPRPSALPESNPLTAARLWSPGVPFAAAAAAEVVAGAVRAVEQAGLPGVAERSPIWSGLAVVRPSELAPSVSYSSPANAPSAFAPAASVTAAPRVTQVAAMDAARASIERIDARVEVMRSTPGERPSALPSSVEVPVSVAPAAAAPAESLSPVAQGEHRLADAARTSQGASSALRTVELLLQAVLERTSPGRAAARAAEMAGAPATAAADGGPAISDVAPSVASADAGVSVEPSSRTNFAPAAGPRVAMPAGLGGLVRSIEAARAVTQPMVRTDVAAPQPPFAALSAAAAASVGAPSDEPAAAGGAVRGFGPTGFAPVWAARPAGALGAVAAAPTRAVDHLTWSDRWLARFAGASPVALHSFEQGDERPSLRPLAAGAPEVVYVHPSLAPESIAAVAARSTPVAPIDARRERPAPVALPPSAALRIDDGEAVSDAIFAAIAAASAPRRPAPAGEPSRLSAEAARAASPSSPPVAPSPVASGSPGVEAFEPARSMAPVDLIAARGAASVADLASVAAPVSPDAGLAAGLASSPMAAALAAVLPMAPAPVFDPRALRGAAIAEAYLGGLIARASSPIGVLAGAPTAANLAEVGAAEADGSAPATWALRDLALAPVQLRLAAAAPDRTFLALGGDVPVALRASRAEAAIHRAPSPTAAASWAVSPAAAMAPTAPSFAAPPVGASPTMAGSPTMAASPSIAAVEAAAQEAAAADLEAAASSASASSATEAARPAPSATERELVVLRNALLASASSPTSIPLVHGANAPLVSATTAVPSAAMPYVLPALGGVGHGESSPLGAAMARHAAAQLADDDGDRPSMSLVAGPASTGASTHTPGAYGRPGSLAESALAWSIAESRTAGGLSFDFVTPEMVLAARVYGLPAGAAADAMRVAAGGPTAMASLAASLDLTFLRAFQSPAAAAAVAATAPRTSAPARGAAGSTLVGEPALAAAEPTPAALAAAGAMPSVPSATGSLGADVVGPTVGGFEASAVDALGLDLGYGGVPSGLRRGRTPRGAYLWPTATTAALGLNAMSPEGDLGLPVVALELLAAQAVAELGTWVTAGPRNDAEPEAGGVVAGRAAPSVAGGPGVVPLAASTASPVGELATSPAAVAARAAALSARAGAPGFDAGDEFEEAAMTATAWAVPSPARQRFESVYVALARSAEGQSLSPSARAARAMSLLTRGDGEARSTRQLAAEAWSVLPHVYRGDLDVVSAGAYGATGADGDPAVVEARPGLAGLASRAGDLLGSFVAPSVAELRGAGGGDEGLRGPATRVEPPVYVENNTRPAPGFAAPRPGRAFTQAGGGESEIPAWFEAAAQKMLNGGDERAASTLAQMVLVTAMPSQQIAAATRGGSSSGGGGGAPQQGGGKQGGVEKPDVEKLAHEVYQEVMSLFALNRMRGGDPFQ